MDQTQNSVGTSVLVSGSSVLPWWVILLIVLAIVAVVATLTICMVVGMKRLGRNRAKANVRENYMQQF